MNLLLDGFHVLVVHLVLEISQLDLEVWCSETLLDAPSFPGNLAGINVYLGHYSAVLNVGILSSGTSDDFSYYSFSQASFLSKPSKKLGCEE